MRMMAIRHMFRAYTLNPSTPNPKPGRTPYRCTSRWGRARSGTPRGGGHRSVFDHAVLHTHTLSQHTHTHSTHTLSLSAHTHTHSTHTHSLSAHTHTLSTHTHARALTRKGVARVSLHISPGGCRPVAFSGHLTISHSHRLWMGVSAPRSSRASRPSRSGSFGCGHRQKPGGRGGALRASPCAPGLVTPWRQPITRMVVLCRKFCYV